MTDRPEIVHVGRAGDIPGGMTQVINAYVQWPFRRTRVSVLESRGDPGDHLTALRLWLGALWRVSRLPRREVALVVHLSERGSFIREGSLARLAAARGIPVIAHLHGSEFVEFATAHPRLVSGVLRASTKVITLSAETSSECERFIDAPRIELVPNAIPAGSGEDKAPTIVFGGVVSERKGIDVLQEAWRPIADAHPDWSLMIAGPIRDHHLVDPDIPGVTFLGSVPHAELMGLLESAAIAVLPSRDEAMPMFLLESMARRCCCVSTTVGGIPPLLSEGSGMLVPPGDADALRHALEELMDDDTARGRIAEAGHRRFMSGYSAEAIYPRVEQIWLDAVNGSAAPSSRL